MVRPVHSRGFFLVEVVVATMVITVVLVYVLGSVQKSVEVSQRALEKTQASYLLEEGAEAIKGIRDSGWSTIGNLSEDTTYYLAWTGSSWAITTTPEDVDAFTRSFRVASVFRDESTSDIVSSGGIPDVGTKLIVMTVGWVPPTGARSETLSLYVSDIRS